MWFHFIKEVELLQLGNIVVVGLFLCSNSVSLLDVLSSARGHPTVEQLLGVCTLKGVNFLRFAFLSCLVQNLTPNILPLRLQLAWVLLARVCCVCNVLLYRLVGFQ